ncbi:RNA-binding S4 domain-containing protein [Methylotenera sp.]|uniref:RNA-binding S4 domain-containing protein n=1 Tax=Methylotenera sp. TaxID=2051956 RepID=UPI002736F840|nr:RNA-binding S4 domain-containing protein [Methylotenera sp.]MDP3212115.1 RNA-binding S4 domain-containing protein [Methylotenera sp.]MDP3777322.1 RNA-binding S4 domain-containing protein [Methylotenera sp.]
METTTFELQGEFIELCNLLKLAGIANSGGQGKVMVSDGIVQVDGNIETRRTAKIRSGQVVECLGHTVKVL